MSYLTPEHKFARRMQRIHLIGIGGSGMSGIAEVLHNLDFKVSGSDQQQSKATERLVNMGVTVMHEHLAKHIEQADVVVYSSAIAGNNPELKAARAVALPVLTRAEMLAELMRFKVGIAVAGTHGKTTTTSLIASILAEAKLDPTFVIGGLLTAAGSHARLGAGEYLVAEADESDGSFELLQPVMAVVTNIDEDHMDTFDNDINVLNQAFNNFIHRVPFYGVTVLCVDDERVAELAEKVSRHKITYGMSPNAQVRAVNIQQHHQFMDFDVEFEGKRMLSSVRLNIPGEYNVLNALAAISVALELDVDAAAMNRALAQFTGVGRRFNIHRLPAPAGGELTLIDDYAHHPTAVAAVIAACRDGWPEQRLVVVFQPHRYSRTRDLFDEFSDVLNDADVLVLSEVYAAGEKEISGAGAVDLSRSIRNRGKLDPIFVQDIEQVPETLAHLLKANDVVLMIGAGSIGAVIQTMVVNQGAYHD
ncbi:UDP-N-acetylmuramate--L-alanine ligase [Marinicella gelatinilytica]|uniref:UDP-N-acetylmuramate--L-alanine ligase n=1 Tax=Marinicella gelatinilytica TaxID=2996017 RepID=UPI002260A060|nr:UDP-N-acetylmuramate--L-alanine ligase [Marinicella gelatinilytica]MCX7545157.1 UDP-N-acetylmuramate--L-alanine ligase [Marinicella gelatinilytica]